jgi:hypothetical protein
MGRQPGSALPPSERDEREGQPVAEHRAVGVFRLARWGWRVTIALGLIVAVLVVVGVLRADPTRNPAPDAYRTAVCSAATELSAGTDALARGIEQREDEAARTEAATEIQARVAAANDAVSDLPEWAPGRAIDELIGSQIITLTNGAAALESEPVEQDLDIARQVDADLRAQLTDGHLGFSCDV